ncbi:hypothetical protein TNCV_4220361 [Trichonephila clavipes]|nr:hypothetical protein TNCV_4220361 [Trichonephila clavipes]
MDAWNSVTMIASIAAPPNIDIKRDRSRSFEHHTGGSTIWLVSTPILKEDTLGWSGASHISSPSTNHTRGFAARGLFIVPPCREGTTHLQASMSSPEFEPRPYGTAVSFANHYTGWPTFIDLETLLVTCIKT